MIRAGRLVLLGCGILLSSGCAGSNGKLDETAASQELVANPRNWAARARLARLRAKSGLPGAALREFARLQRVGQLPARDRAQFASLLLERAKMGLAYADPLTADDLALAQQYGADGRDLRAEVYALAAVSALRHSSHFRQAKAPHWIGKLHELSPDDYRGLPIDDARSTEALIEIFQWLDTAGAKRKALEVAVRYVDAGGRDPLIVKRWIALHRWWYGDRRDPMPSVLARDVEGPQDRLGDFSELTAGLDEPTTSGVADTLMKQWGLTASDWTPSLHAIELAMEQEPARAERLAQRFVDETIYSAPRLVIVVELFHRLQQPLLAERWALKLVEEYPKKPSYLLVGALASAAARSVGPCQQLTTKAAAASGDPGLYQALVARRLRLSGEPLAAIAAGRIALGLSAPGQDVSILFELYRAQKARGRDEDAIVTLAALQERFPKDQRPAVVALVGMTTDGPVGLVAPEIRPSSPTE